MKYKGKKKEKHGKRKLTEQLSAIWQQEEKKVKFKELNKRKMKWEAK